MMTIRVYIAGPIKSLDPSQYLKNVYRMINRADEVKQLGFAVYVPALDMLMGTTTGRWVREDYLENSLAWLEVSDALLYDSEEQMSDGVSYEIAFARDHGIEVFNDIEALKRYYEEFIARHESEAEGK